jgi:hypothetical protein
MRTTAESLTVAGFVAWKTTRRPRHHTAHDVDVQPLGGQDGLYAIRLVVQEFLRLCSLV